MSTADAWTVIRDALRVRWRQSETPATVVGWAFAALEAAGDRTVPRHQRARDEAEIMVGMVFADIGDEADAGTVAGHIIRAAAVPALDEQQSRSGGTA